MPDRTTYCLSGHVRKTLLLGKLPGKLTVGHGLPVGYLQKKLPHFLPECRADRVQRWREIGLIARKVHIEPALCINEYRRFTLNAFVGQVIGKKFLPFKPQAGQSDIVGCKQNPAQRGSVLLSISHGVYLVFGL